MKILVLFILLLSTAAAFAQQEPAYCDLKKIQGLEERVDKIGLERPFLFNFGKVKILGVGVGDSEVEALKSKAKSFGITDPKYCTFYFNDGSEIATKTFTWRNLDNPIWPWNTARSFEKTTQDLFSTGPESFINCADAGYIALGCDGMRHRGPSMFSMILSFSGCKPESSVKIVEHYWKHNWVTTKKRLDIAERAYKLGLARPELSAKLRTILENK